MLQKVVKESLRAELREGKNVFRVPFLDLAPSVQGVVKEISRQRQCIVAGSFGYPLLASMTQISSFSLLTPICLGIHFTVIRELYQQCEMLLRQDVISQDTDKLKMRYKHFRKFRHFYVSQSDELVFTRDISNKHKAFGRLLRDPTARGNESTDVDSVTNTVLAKVSRVRRGAHTTVLKYEFSDAVLSENIDRLLLARRVRFRVPLTLATVTYAFVQCMSEIWAVDTDIELSTEQLLLYGCPALYGLTWLFCNWLHSGQCYRLHRRVIDAGENVKALLTDAAKSRHRSLMYDYGYVDIVGNLVCSNQKPLFRKTIKLNTMAK